MGQLFGTDGIRGIAGKYPLTTKDVFLIGQCAGQVLKKHFDQDAIRLVLVRDTRESGPTLAKNLTAGLRSVGIDVYDAGVLCTPSVAYLVKAHRFQSGVVISASHNPPEFNGIKFFNQDGRKWPDTWEEATEKLILSPANKRPKAKPKNEQGHYVNAEMLAEDYESFLMKTLPKGFRLDGFKLAVDCSNGANSEIGPRVLKKLGAKVHVMGATPSGRNINVKCGSQYLVGLGELVKRKKCQLGVAFDGDGDRVIFVDEKGHSVDGDFIIGLLAKYLKQNRSLKNGKAVITVMSNLGLRVALSKIGIKTVETRVGDRYVSEAMKQNNLILGGEQSGHIILGRYLPTGDGLLTALHVLSVVSQLKKPFSKIVGWMKRFPQTLVNVRVKEKVPIPQLDGVHKRIKEIEKNLGNKGRVLVRYSGTEPLLRIMLEGPDKKKIDQYANDIAKKVSTAV